MPFLCYTTDGKIKYALTSNMLVGPVLTVSGNTTLDTSDYVVLVNATATITLPDATTNPGRQYIIKSIGSGITVTITTTSSQRIDGAAPPLTITDSNVSVSLISNGTGWYIL